MAAAAEAPLQAPAEWAVAGPRDVLLVPPRADPFSAAGTQLGGLVCRRQGAHDGAALVAAAGAAPLPLPGVPGEQSVYDLDEARSVAPPPPEAAHFVALRRHARPLVLFYAYDSAGGARAVTARTRGSLLLEDSAFAPLLTLVRRALGGCAHLDAGALPPPLQLLGSPSTPVRVLAFELVAGALPGLVHVDRECCELIPVFAQLADGSVRALVPDGPSGAVALLKSSSLSSSSCSSSSSSFEALLRPVTELAATVAELQAVDEAANEAYRAQHACARRYDYNCFARAGHTFLLLDAAMHVVGSPPALLTVEPSDLEATLAMNLEPEMMERVRTAVRDLVAADQPRLEPAVREAVQLSGKEWRRFGKAIMELVPVFEQPTVPPPDQLAGDLPLVILLVGLPGCGKSRFVSELTARSAAPVVRVSQDVLGSAPRCMEVMVEALTHGQSVIIDRTNIDLAQRQRWVALAHQAGTAQVVAVFLDYPLWLCKARVLRRPAHETLPADPESLLVVDRFHQWLVPPVPEEGLTRVLHVRNDAELAAVANQVAALLPAAPRALSPPKDILKVQQSKGGGKRRPPAGGAGAPDPAAGGAGNVPRYLRQNAAGSEDDHFYVYNGGYLGVAGPAVDALVQQVQSQVPRLWEQNMQRRRQGPTHITLVDPGAWRRLVPEQQATHNLSDAVATMRHLLRQCEHTALDWTLHGVGCHKGLSPSGLPTRTMFAIVEWPQGQAARAAWQLPAHDFHITLGFTVCDLWGQRKDSSSRADTAPWLAQNDHIAELQASLAARVQPCVRVRDAILRAEASAAGLQQRVRGLADDAAAAASLTDEALAGAILDYLRAECGASWDTPAGKAACSHLVRLGSPAVQQMLAAEPDNVMAERYAKILAGTTVPARAAATGAITWLPIGQGGLAAQPLTRETQNSAHIQTVWYAGAQQVVLAAPSSDKKASKFVDQCATVAQLPASFVAPAPDAELTPEYFTALREFCATAAPQLDGGATMAVFGTSRSATVTILSLLLHMGCSLDEAVARCLTQPHVHLDSLKADDVAFCLRFQKQ